MISEHLKSILQLVGFFTSFIAFAILMSYLNNKRLTKKVEAIMRLQWKVIAQLKAVKCETFTSGAINKSFLFRRADVICFDDAFLIVGYMPFRGFKVYKSVILLSRTSFLNEEDLPIKLTRPKRINIHASMKDVYIEFGESGFGTTNVEIRLKNLTEEERILIKI